MTTNAEKDFYHLSVSVSKALNGIEAPLKSKHARSVIIIIHKSKEARTFWSVVTRQPIMESRFTAWKFCHLVHKVLREAHECVLMYSQKHKKMILEVGKLWGHLQDDIGCCIKVYTAFLVTKLNFHDKNRNFPGSLIVSFAQIATAANKDLNYYFQLCVEIFDYLDDIIALQVAIFASINTYRISSMTQPGQCRLAPLIPLIQDSNPLYDMSVRLMFKLHEKLPNDVLGGHRERFSGIFAKLKLFYENVRPLQYFSDLITVPQLPEQSPNFKSQVDFGSYIPPVVLVQSEPDPVVEDLVDTNVSENIAEQQQIFDQRINMLENTIEDRNQAVNQLKSSVETWRSNFEGLEQSYKHDVLELQESNSALYNDLTALKEECANLRMEKDELELKLTNTPLLNQKIFEEEEKQKLSLEKFNKLKTMYTQIRDEHINLLRQHGEFSKSLNKEKQVNAEMLLQIKELSNEILKTNENIAAEKSNSSTLSQELESQKSLNSNIESGKKEMEMKYEAMIQKKENENHDLYSKVNILNEINIELENVKLALQEKSQELSNAESLINKKNDEILENQMTYDRRYLELTTKNKELQETIESETKALRAVLGETEQKLQQRENGLQVSEASLTKLNQEKELSEKLVIDLQEKLTHHKEVLVQTTNRADSLQISNDKCQDTLLTLRKLTIQTVKDICASKLNNEDQQPSAIVPKIAAETGAVLQKIKSTSHIPIDECIEKVQDIIYSGFYFMKLYEQCDKIYTTTTDIEKGQDILNKICTICPRLLQLFDVVQKEKGNQEVNATVDDIQMQLCELVKLIQEVISSSENSIDHKKLLEVELKEMDKAIEEASTNLIELLSKSRENDNKIQLEVNEKILSACTSLMECIKVLILKSRVLQQEIVSSQKGTATENEFYKRNSQWSDGLISASKSVAKGANYLVEAANNAIDSESGQNFELIVAAQEIAACTVQLVMASKVKANRESQNLSNLTVASRNVTKATGAVVATVKDGNLRREQQSEIDFCKLTPSQLKTVEMDIQVKVLELEQALQSQRVKLSSFRREHYQKTEY